jgi:hypothetical protein
MATLKWTSDFATGGEVGTVRMGGSDVPVVTVGRDGTVQTALPGFTKERRAMNLDHGKALAQQFLNSFTTLLGNAP